MILLKPVFYSKIGNHSDYLGMLYKYYLGSIDPHFYFAIYLVPNADTFDIFYVPQVNNILDNGVIDLSDNNPNSIRNIKYGETVTITLTNPYLDGFGRMIDVSFSIDDKPVAININSVSQVDLDAARNEARKKIKPLQDIGLYTLSNVLLIEVESKLSNIMQLSVGVIQEKAISTIINSVLSVKNIFMENLPKNMDSKTAERMYLLYLRALNVAPTEKYIPVIFSDAIQFARIIDKMKLNIFNIPYEILFRLMTDWMKSKHSEYITLLKKASLAVVHSESISINMSTMEDTSKVYELLNKIQNFVYLTNIRFTNDNTGESVDFPLENEYFENYVKTSNDCVEVKGIPSSNGVVLIQYGYGTQCDNFIGLFSIDNSGTRRGLRRDNKIIDNKYVIARTWQWGTDKTVKVKNEIDSSGNITVKFTGV